MIYLIEDKTSRRNDYGWTDEKVQAYNDVLTVVDNANELKNLKHTIQNEGNVVLYHESFTQREYSYNRKPIENFIYSIENSGVNNIAYFSGSKSNRSLNENVCNLPAYALYTNLESFVNHYRNGQPDFHYLMFGENPEIEDIIQKTIQKINNNNINPTIIETQRKILVFTTFDDSIQFPVSNVFIKGSCDLKCNDKDLINLISEQSSYKYEAIYIPLCMGETLSDFLGLRLALLFRLYNSANKYAHIFIYGDVDYSLFIKNECAEIFKMPGVSYISANASSLKESLASIRCISENEYRLGLKKIHLNVPSDIGDNHSVSNIWSEYRWSLALGQTDSNILKITNKIDSTLYFLFLSALYPPSVISCIDKEKLIIDNNEQKSDLNILYVDDEADERWDELLYHIFYTVNGIEKYDSIGNDLKSLTQEEIITLVMDKVIEMDSNMVILDLRLHPEDFSASNIEDITGYKLLKEIKKYNRGIQVLMFSATNKIWNLQALQEEGADGFIMKESPENSVDPQFTEESINGFIKQIRKCSQLTFRKDLWLRIQKLNKRINKLLNLDNIDEKFGNNCLTIISMAEDALFDSRQTHFLDNAFISLFSLIELTANEWIGVKKELYGYRFYFTDNEDPLYFFEKGDCQPKNELKYEGKGLSYYNKITNTLYHVGAYDSNVAELVNKRNKFTHPEGELTYFTENDILQIFTVVEKIIFRIKDY